MEQAKQSIQESIDKLKAFGLLELYQLDAVNIGQIQLDIQWTIDALEIVNKQMNEEIGDMQFELEECWGDENREKLTQQGKRRLKPIHEAVKEFRSHKREIKKKIDNLLQLINFIGKKIGLQKAVSIIFDEEKWQSRYNKEIEKQKRADFSGREYKSKFEKLMEQRTGFLESIFG